MDIILVTSTVDDIVHGADSEKKTGCGINLQKGENVTRFRRSGIMTDLKEITCERCKGILAKKLIKADKKEMARLLKEERQREKLGIIDEGIIPLGNTTAKITSAQPVRPPKPKPPAPAPSAPVQPAPSAPEQPAKTIPGTGIAIDNDLAQFAINVPAQKEEPAPQPEPVQQTPPPAPSPANNVKDDFLAQFAIEKPQEEKPAPANNIQDDFLAQFAVQKPDEDDEDTTAPAPDANGQVYGDATGMSNYNYENYQSVSSVPEDEEDEPAEPNGPALVNAGMADEDELMKMFSFGFGMPLSQNQPVQQANVQQPVQQAYQPEQPAYEPVQQEYEPLQNEADDSAFDSIPESEPIETEENTYGDYGISEPSLYGQYQNEIAEEPDEMQNFTAQPDLSPAIEDIQPYSQPVQQSAPPVIEDIAIEDIVVPQINPIRPVQQSAPVAPPVLDDLIADISVPQMKAPHQTAHVAPPVLDDIAIEDITVPQINPVRPVQQSVPEYTEPVQEEPAYDYGFEQENVNEGIAELNLPDNIEDIKVPEIKPVSIKKEEPVAKQPKKPRTAKAVKVTAPQPQPVQNVAPQPQPVQNVAPQPVVQPIQNIAPQPVVQPIQNIAPQPQPVQNIAPQPVVQPVAQTAPMAGQIVNVPQFAGYDANNQPIYTYIQMQMSYDANGQPIYMPLQNMQIPNMPVPNMQYQQTAVPPMQTVQPVIQPAPAHTVPTAETNEPLTVGQKIMAAEAARKAAGITDNIANISKIAVHEHSRSTSQAFINAISVSKEYANQSLTETEGLMTRGPVLDSIEDILSSMGDNSLKNAKQQKANAQQQVPVYQEYRASAPQTARRPSPAKQEISRPLSPAELKEKKKQDKIDAKFRKKMGL